MVGYNPEEYKLSTRDYASVGAICGFVSRVVCQPLDVIKIRFQLQVEPILKSQQSKYWGVHQAFRSIIKEEGVTALWKGHVPAQILSVFYGLSQFAAFEVLTSVTWKYLPEKLTTDYRPLTHSVCGGLAGCIAITVAQPADVMRTRFVTQGKNKIYTSLGSGVRTLVKEEGFLALYKGLVPAVTQIGPQMGLQFGFYASFQDLWRQIFEIDKHTKTGVSESLLCGSAAGILSKMIIYPLDVIKMRLEIQGFEKARKDFGSVRHYNGLTDCLTTIVKQEGARGLFKGLSPSLLKAGLAASSNFLVYEQCCYLLRVFYLSSS